MMVDPETARQAVQAWNEAIAAWMEGREAVSIQDSGDALAVLVPQLLDQLEREQEQNDGLHQAVLMGSNEQRALLERCRQAEQERDTALTSLDATLEVVRFATTDEVLQHIKGETPWADLPDAPNMSAQEVIEANSGTGEFDDEPH